MRIRQMVRDQQPLCVMCLADGKVKPWDELDHIDGNPLNNQPENLQGLCLRHHDEKTRRQLGYKPSGECGLDGLPLTPDHPWNRED